MANSQHKGPKGSEVPIQEWLEQIGATDISHVGERNSPPDFTVMYSSKRIAIEKRCGSSAMSWTLVRIACQARVARDDQSIHNFLPSGQKRVIDGD